MVSFSGAVSLLNIVRHQFCQMLMQSTLLVKPIMATSSEEQETSIHEAKSTKTANEIVFMYLLQQAMLSSLKKLCPIMTSAKGYARMREFGQMLHDNVSFFGECTLL